MRYLSLILEKNHLHYNYKVIMGFEALHPGYIFYMSNFKPKYEMFQTKYFNIKMMFMIQIHRFGS